MPLYRHSKIYWHDVNLVHQYIHYTPNIAECWFGPTIAVLQSTLGQSRTGTAQGMFVLTGALANLAPTLLGSIYGNQISGQLVSSSSPEILANLLAWGVCAGYLLSSIFFAVSAGASDSEPNVNDQR